MSTTMEDANTNNMHGQLITGLLRNDCLGSDENIIIINFVLTEAEELCTPTVS